MIKYTLLQNYLIGEYKRNNLGTKHTNSQILEWYATKIYEFCKK